jgi:DNA-binding transcriptional ArsR family regulator
MNALGDPTRRAIFERLAAGPKPVGELAKDLPVSRPAVSQHLRVLRDSGFASVRAEGTRRLYAVEPAPLREVDVWLEQFRRFWSQRLDALATELARGRRARRIEAAGAGGPPETDKDGT